MTTTAHTRGIETPEYNTPDEYIPRTAKRPTTAQDELLASLDAETREEAKRRMKTLTQQGYREPVALRMGIVLAKEWADNGKSRDDALPGPSQHVMYDLDEWIICSEGDSEPSARFNDFEDTLRRAHELATRYHSTVYVHDADGCLIDKYEGYGGDIADGYHIMPWNDAWAIKLEGANGEFETFDTKRAALKEARKRAKKAATMLVVHYQNGDVQRTRDLR